MAASGQVLPEYNQIPQVGRAHAVWAADRFNRVFNLLIFSGKHFKMGPQTYP